MLGMWLLPIWPRKKLVLLLFKENRRLRRIIFTDPLYCQHSKVGYQLLTEILEGYLSLFNTVAMIHGWMLAFKAVILYLSLQRGCIGGTTDRTMANRENVDKLLRNLEKQFGHRHMEQFYRTQLKNRIQKYN